MNDAETPIRTRWDVIALLFGTALGSITLVPAYGFIFGFEPWLWPWFIGLLLWNGLSITAGYHRLWSHKSYVAHPAVRAFFALGGALSFQNSIKEWCSNHRKHHRFVDDEEKDPYSARRGFFYSHIGWMLKDYPATVEDYSNITDLERDPIVNWQHKYYWHLAGMMNLLVPLAIGGALGDAVGGFLLLGVFRLVVCHHTTFFINSLAHAWGSQPYSDAHTSRDNPVIALLTYGEGYHNYHHTFQWDYRNGIRWYQFDPTKWLIRSLSLVGLAHSLKRVGPEKIEKALAAMQLKRATDHISNSGHIHMDQWLEHLEAEYEKLIHSLNEWAQCRQEWFELKKATVLKRFDATELRAKLKSLEAQLDLQRRQWRMLTAQFA